jgi:hypothetical protein
MKCSCHSLIPFLRILKTQLDYSRLLFYTPLYSVYSDYALLQLLGTDSTENTVFSCQECMFTGLLRSSGCPIVVCACVAGMYLPTCCLAIGIHITLLPP